MKWSPELQVALNAVTSGPLASTSGMFSQTKATQNDRVSKI
jgi:hypothetical protein